MTQQETSIQDQEQEALRQAAEWECRMCCGTKEYWYLIGSPGDDNWNDKPCSDCRDSKGNPSGRQLPGLSRECPGWLIGHPSFCACHTIEGSRLPVSPAEALKWLMELCVDVQIHQFKNNWDVAIHRLGEHFYYGKGKSLLLALIAAVTASLEGE